MQGRIQGFWKGGGVANSRQGTPSNAKHAGTRGLCLPRKILKIDAKILQFRGISTHYTTQV